ncbi:hypothetical protein [Pseudactinotalea terrae]|uniref:hypothetical protein n=1 Tax=Pseudactinotalea terrae TaxID=1743262 RepID=UPI0012E0D897|nr:hypothetical protein [Pseudactinotalea terrae]
MTATLEEAAQRFATELTATVQGALGQGCSPFRVQQVRSNLTVSQQPDRGLSLCCDGQPWLTLEAVYYCEWNSTRQYLRIRRSKIRLLYGENPRPLVRYDYEPENHLRRLPAAHVQIHESATGDMGALQYEAGDASRRARRRKQEFDRGAVPRQDDIHFPVGGDRFRPILEDVLQMLIEEYGIDREDGWERVLADSREAWRLGQIAAAAYDGPDVAARALREQGYEVNPPAAGDPPRRQDALRYP